FLQSNFSYLVIYVTLIVFFSFFWTAVQFNPIKMADDMKQYGHFVPGIRPGKMTALYLERLMTRITLAGAAFLTFIAIMPQAVHQLTGVSYGTAYMFGGTGLLIVVGVALEIVQKVESQLMMRHYEGFMKKGRIRGRGGR
ncbi:preprotein translocase subunit SecY, partial [bacterium]|nr:preprotein translocase subunit SecY [bacterium]